MGDKKHALLTPANGIHPIIGWPPFADAASRTAQPVTSFNVGKAALQLDDLSVWLLVDAGEGGIWRRLDNVFDLADLSPLMIEAYTETPTEDGFAYTGQADPGVEETAARRDHAHAISTGTPVSIGSTNEEGSSPELARADHVHDGTTLLESGSESAPSEVRAYREIPTEGLPDYVGEASTGTSPYAARADHVHNIETAAPVAIGNANAEGTSSALARADHVHDGSGLTLTPVVDYTGTAHTLAAADAGKLARYANAANITLTVPTNAAVPIPVGRSFLIKWHGLGQLTVAWSGGVTVETAMSHKLRAPKSVATLLKTGVNTWELFGDLYL